MNEDIYKKLRYNMVEQQIKRRGIKNQLVLSAMKKVKRHLFVPLKFQNCAYDDKPLPIGMGQTISQPYIVAFMTEKIDPKKNFRVLEIGTGSGYQAAVLAEIVKEVYTIEIIEDIFNAAKTRLTNLNYTNIHLKCADGYQGWQSKSPFDAIVVTAAAKRVPEPLLQQLKKGGKMIIPIGDQFQNLVLYEKIDENSYKKEDLLPVLFVPMTGKIREK